jgi:hypothetical protein
MSMRCKIWNRFVRDWIKCSCRDLIRHISQGGQGLIGHVEALRMNAYRIVNFRGTEFCYDCQEKSLMNERAPDQRALFLGRLRPGAC